MFLYLCFDLCAVIIMITLIMALIIRKLTKGRSNRLFLVFCVTVLLTGLFDLASEFVDKLPNETDYYTLLKYFLDYMYFIVHNLSTPVLIAFLYSVLGMWKIIRNRGFIHYICGLMYGGVLLLLAMNIFNRKIFYFDENGMYNRGEWLPVIYLITMAYLFIGGISLIKYRYLISKAKFVVFISFIPLTIAAVAAQAIFRQFRIEVFAVAIMSVAISVIVQRPEDMIDFGVGLQSYNAFMVAVRNNFAAQNDSSYLFIKIDNNRSLRSNLGLDKYMQLLQTLASKLEQICQIMNLKGEAYYLDHGNYGVIADVNYYADLLDVGRTALAYMMEPVRIDQMEVMVDARVCIVNCPEDIASPDSLLIFANTFQSKLPNETRVISVSQIAKTKEFKMRNEMEAIINRGIAEHKFQMYYQPIYSTKERRFVSAEALIRLIDDRFGFVSPAIFIPAAEESGAIRDIGDFVLEDVCKFIGSDEFKRLGLRYVEINLSVAQCIEEKLFEKIQGLMKKYGVKPEQINLEITETSADYDPVITDRNIGLLSNAGISFSLDDYGTGYSNISRVVKLPLDIVKLDKCLVDDMDSPLMWIVIKNTVSMLKRMEKKILVEGIEDERALKKFTEIGCDYIQGYYFSKPMPKDAFVSFIKEKNNVLEN